MSSRSGAKLFVSIAILVAAFLLARPFRHDRTGQARFAPQVVEEVVLRETPAPGDVEVLRTEAPTAEIQPTLLRPPADSGGGDGLDRDVDRLDPPPAMAHAYPGSSPRRQDAVDETMGGPLSTGQRVQQRIHTVRDGDTLESLAQLYLGDRNRWREIYAANRDKIDRPALLPLSTSLVIPPRNRPPGKSTEEPHRKRLTQAPLVPVGP